MKKKKVIQLYKFNGYFNDPEGYGAGGYRLEFFDVIAPNLTEAKKLIKKAASKEGWEGKIERTKKVKTDRKIGVYH